MFFFLVGFGVWLHVLFWGAGAAWLCMPRRWKRFWPVLAGPVGIALQMLVVWAGAYADLKGTASYAFVSEIIPVVLLAAATWRHGARPLLRETGRWLGVAIASAACLSALLAIMAVGSRGVGLTTISLGSCDAADYAAGARVLQEFARSGRGGFMGLEPVVQVLSAADFFTYWLKLNHFTPSALIALNGSIFDCTPREMTGVVTAVLLALSIPVVFWLARAVLRYSTKVSLGVALLYGFSPVTWYAVFQVATGQLLAAMAIALITWAGVALWRTERRGRNRWEMSGVLVVAYAIILGSYNFILLIALVPAVAYVGGLACWQSRWHRLPGWALPMLLPLGLAGIIFYDRVAGLAERFQLLQSFDFGWKIPALTPEGWLGMVRGPALDSFPLAMRAVLLVLVLSGLILAVRSTWRRRESYIVLALSGPAIVGYLYLYLRGLRLGTNASYDAYKILAVFFPGVLAAACFWMVPRFRNATMRRWWVGGLTALTAVLTLHADYRFAERLRFPPLVAGKELAEMQQIEQLPDVASVNLRIPDMWSRLWANAFLLKKPQYFPTHTYEARRNTPLQGEWDLNGDLIQTVANDAGVKPINRFFSLVDTRSPSFIRADFAEGWYDFEGQPPAQQRWRWSRSNAAIALSNPHAYPVEVSLHFTAIESASDRDLQIWFDGKQQLTTKIGPAARTLDLLRVPIAPGSVQRVELRSGPPTAPAASGDPRELVFRFFRVELRAAPSSR